MTLHILVSLIAFASYGGVMALIFGHGLKNNKPSQLFFLYTACMLLVQMTYMMISLARDSQDALFWYSMTAPLTAAQTIVYFFFTRAFLDINQPRRFLRAGIVTWLLALTIFTVSKPYFFFTHIYQDEATGLFVPEVTNQWC